MSQRQIPTPHPREEFLAELTDAAYRVALCHGLRGSFLRVQLDMWSALRAVLAGWEAAAGKIALSSVAPEGTHPDGASAEGPCRRFSVTGAWLCSA